LRRSFIITCWKTCRESCSVLHLRCVSSALADPGALKHGALFSGRSFSAQKTTQKIARRCADSAQPARVWAMTLDKLGFRHAASQALTNAKLMGAIKPVFSRRPEGPY
jgi:hypothetical protein